MKADPFYLEVSKEIIYINHIGKIILLFRPSQLNKNANLTSLGYELYEIGKTYGYNSRKYFYKFAKIIWSQGKHFDLIKDIKKYSHNLEFASITDAKKHVFCKFEDAEDIKRNPNRAVKKDSTKLFSITPSLDKAWNHFWKAHERYTSGYGFNFYDEEIENTSFVE